ncbi:hypothetical protein NA57DRAFT_54546 [Rhizodiscina lignyota]|uniref:Uncharacterized protein n=1 Tax=Rhizodiscina lignyota TaxID=1504668 RepID=A0A9P4II81_9PEZI|nr:hypothetical protein NA57DRAFT_54546 [Rhizodiscina lignyota]
MVCLENGLSASLAPYSTKSFWHGAKEYRTEEDDSASWTLRRYVQPFPYDRFTIDVGIAESFNYYNADALRYTISIGEEQNHIMEWIEWKRERKSLPVHRYIRCIKEHRRGEPKGWYLRPKRKSRQPHCQYSMEKFRPSSVFKIVVYIERVVAKVGLRIMDCRSIHDFDPIVGEWGCRYKLEIKFTSRIPDPLVHEAEPRFRQYSSVSWKGLDSDDEGANHALTDTNNGRRHGILAPQGTQTNTAHETAETKTNYTGQEEPIGAPKTFVDLTELEDEPVIKREKRDRSEYEDGEDDEECLKLMIQQTDLKMKLRRLQLAKARK